MMTNILNLPRELLDNNRWELLDKLRLFYRDYILGGGTALSLQLQHRLSFDFDFFSSKDIPMDLLPKLSKEISISRTAVNNTDELTFFDEHGIKVTFLYYPFQRQLDPVQLENGCLVYQVQEIAAHKAYTIGRRGEYRDYFDLYIILKEKRITLPELEKIAKEIYGNLFDSKIFLEQLTYFGDLRSLEIIPVNSKQQLAAPDEVKSFLEKSVKDYLEAGL